jgi:hypothetical protein
VCGNCRFKDYKELIVNMKKIMSIMLGLSLIVGSAAISFAAPQEKEEKGKGKGKKGKEKKELKSQKTSVR